MYYMYSDTENDRKLVVACVSIGIAVIKFCGVTIWSFFHFLLRCRHRPNLEYNNIADNENVQVHVQPRPDAIHHSGQFRVSILEDAPLIYN